MSIEKSADFSFALKKFRTDSGATQEEAGKILGVSGDYISQLELGKKTPSKSLLRLLQKHVSEVSPGYTTIKAVIDAGPEGRARIEKDRELIEHLGVLWEDFKKEQSPSTALVRKKIVLSYIDELVSRINGRKIQ